MKHKKSLGFCAVFLAVALLLAACGQPASSGTGEESPSAVQESSAAAGEAAGAAGGNSYPIVTDGSIELTYWTPLNASAAKFISNFSENTAYQQMQEDTGIKLKFIHPAAGQEKEQFNLLIASNDLPDILAYAQAYNGGEFQGMRDGFFLDLTDKLPALAPEYYKLIQEDEEFFREVSDDDGRITAFCGYKPQGDPPYRRVILRNDVLEEIGVAEVPRTIDEYEAMFDKMLAAGITPYLPIKDIKGVEMQFAGIFGLYAESTIAEGVRWGKKEDGSIYLAHIEPEFKDYLTLMNKWYQKGYIYKDFTSVDEPQANTMFDTKQVGMIIGPIVANYNRSQSQDFTVTSAPYPRLQEGDQLHYEFTDIWPRMNYNETTAVITKDCQYVDEAIRLMNWGVEGVNWDTVDGKRTYNDTMLNNEKFGTEEASYIYKMHFAPKLTYLDTECHANLLKSPGALESRFWHADDPNVDSSHRLPPFQLSSEALSRRASIMSNVTTYCDEMVLKFIIGTEPLDNFDKYVETVKSMGVDEAIQLTQEAYDQYMNKTLQ